MLNPDFLLENYNYELPENMIAQVPAQPVESAKLLLKIKDKIEDLHFFDLPNVVTDNDVFVCNNTKVYKARIPLNNTKVIRKSWEIRNVDGEIFVYQLLHDWNLECLVSDDKNFKPWAKVFIDETFWIILNSLEYAEDWIVFSVEWISVYDFLEKYGQMPLPPYIKYEKEKEIWYQTTFAENIWSAAAPTASLHFSQNLIQEIQKKWSEFYFSTLHVWLWTFKPVYESDIRNQRLHLEPIIIEKNLFHKIYERKKWNKNLIAVWTTMVRLLETLPYLWSVFSLDDKNNLNLTNDEITFWNRNTWDIHEEDVNKYVHNVKIMENQILCDTQLFIYPWRDFRIIDEMITNFHLPKSSLLMLVSALMWREETLKTYEHAKENWYKFYSFWDGMRIRK